VAKWDSIEKDASRRKAHDGKWFMDPKCGHAKNEIVDFQLSTIIVFQQLSLCQAMEDKEKLVQFAIVFNLLSKGKPMIDYEDFQPLFKFLKL
jgi:hypothetical protein